MLFRCAAAPADHVLGFGIASGTEREDLLIADLASVSPANHDIVQGQANFRNYPT